MKRAPHTQPSGRRRAGGDSRLARSALLPLLASLAALALPARRAEADPVPIQLRGGARLAISGVAQQDALVLRGELTDDVPVPIGDAAVSVQVFADPSATTPLALPRPAPCEPGGDARAKLQGKAYLLRTDERGAFCVVAPGRFPTGAVLRGRYAGDRHHDPAEALESASLAPSEGAARVVLRLEPSVGAVDLDRPSFVVTAVARLERSQGEGERAPGLPLTLEDEAGRKLGSALTSGEGKARFEIKTEALGAPGEGQLIVRFPGQASLPASSARQPLLRRAEARLVPPERIEPGDAAEGVPILVGVHTIRGPAHGGVVEAFRGSESVGAGKVEGGEARVVVTLPDERGGEIPVTLRFVPSAPHLVPGPDVEVSVPLRGPSLWRQGLLAALVAAAAAWVLAGWRRAPKRAAPVPPEAPAPSGKPGVVVVAARQGEEGWRGIVTDAHEGTPLAGARLRVFVPTFGSEGPALSATADAEGRFVLEGTFEPGAKLVVDAPEHSTHEQALPPPSVLSVALVTRRRAVLERLVRWSRRVGAPFDAPPEPTPGHVRRAARRGQQAEVETWAGLVEQAAFGPGRVDAELEESVRRTEPKTPG